MRLEKLWDNGKCNLSFCKAAFHMKGRHHLVCMRTSYSYQLERGRLKKKKRASEQVFPVFAEAQIRTKELLDKQLITQSPEALQISNNRKPKKKKREWPNEFSTVFLLSSKSYRVGWIS